MRQIPIEMSYGVRVCALIAAAMAIAPPFSAIAQNLTPQRVANEARYAKAEALAKSPDHQWTYVPNEGGTCRPLGLTTPFRFMQAVSARRHHTQVSWDSPLVDENVERSIFANNNDPSVPLKDGPVQEFVFYISSEACDAAAANLLAQDGIKISGADLDHRPAVKWVITDQTTLKVACHWPNTATGKSPREFLATLRQLGANITEVSHSDIATEDRRTIFGITFAYSLKGHSNQISWADLGDYSCDPHVRDRLQLP